ncbi:MAG: phosphomannose isomerase type II C-terminal cupin domain [Rhizobiales bacterium]|nr:phosphomannose isomerase type II C-terminal cupin domain [Hyphomicrobiales bacterium]
MMNSIVPTVGGKQDGEEFTALLPDHQDAMAANAVHRPWGSFESIINGNGYQVKRIVVSAGKKLSLQYHHHRSEHWTVVTGTAHVTLNDDVLILQPDESIYIPLGAVHRIDNQGDDDIVLIEVQCGDYLGEDDIVRIEDDFGRV